MMKSRRNPLVGKPGDHVKVDIYAATHGSGVRLRTPRANAVMCLLFAASTAACAVRLLVLQAQERTACALVAPFAAHAFEQRAYSVAVTNETCPLRALKQFARARAPCTHVVVALDGVPLADAGPPPPAGEWHGLHDAANRIEAVPSMSGRFTFKRLQDVPRALASPAVVHTSTLRRLLPAWDAIHERMLADDETRDLWGDARVNYALCFAMAHLNVRLVANVARVPEDASVAEGAAVARLDTRLVLLNADGLEVWRADARVVPPAWEAGMHAPDGPALSEEQHAALARVTAELGWS